MVAALALVAVMPHLPGTAEPASLPQYERTRILEDGRHIGDVELTNHRGEAFRLSELKGRVAFIFFGFTNCPDVCPMTMAKFRQLQDSGVVDSEDIAFVLISVDGERDSPAVMKEFLGLFSDRIIGLTEEPAKIKKLAKEFRASFFKGSASPHDAGYSIAHSPQVFVLDPQGRLRAEMYDAPVKAMAGVASTLLSEATKDDSQD